MEILETIREYNTKNFRVRIAALPEYEPVDLDWDESGEFAGLIERGEMQVFCAAVLVYLRGNLVGSCYLGQCIYKDYSEFMNSGYVPQMVAEACRETRQYLERLPRLRTA